jgi:two-component system, chemotaxis family, sensor kinase CheA
MSSGPKDYRDGSQDKLFTLFAQDGRNMIDALREIVSDLHTGGFRRDLLNKAFRYAHSVKSESAFLGFDDLSRQAHSLEDMFAEMRERTSAPDAEKIAAFQRVIDTMDRLFSRILRESETPGQKASRDTDSQMLKEAWLDDSDPDELFRLSLHQQSVLREARARKERVFRFCCEVTEPEPMLYARVYLVVNNLERIVNVVKTTPALENLPPGAGTLTALITTRLDPEEVERAADVDGIDNIVLTELDYHAMLGKPASDEQGYRSGIMAGLSTVSVKMPIRTYEQLCLYTDELRAEVTGMLQGMKSESEIDRQVLQRFALVEKLASLVSDSIGESSVVPLHPVFSRVGSFISKLAHRLDKKVRFHSTGGSHTVFLPVSEVLLEVLTHLTRNALDHGLEPSEERIRAGKKPHGEIRVYARSDGGKLVIEVADDGKGIDETFVRSRFAESGGTPEGMALLEILSTPGFSTRSNATDLSGRGVGLDLVSHVVSAVLGGSLTLENTPGTGCRFMITLPIEAGLISVLVVRSAGKECALPAAEIYETIDMDGRNIQKDEKNKEYIRYGGEYVPVVRVYPSSGKEKYGLIVRSLGNQRVVPVDELVSEETVVRNRSARDTVYSQTLERDVPLVVPVRII